MMSKIMTLELSRETMSFSAGHFMIFSEKEREYLHGHNYMLSAAMDFPVSLDGVSFDCQHYIDLLSSLCQKYNRVFLLPTKSKYLHISEDEKHYYATFSDAKIPFLKEDVLLLPISNISMEELVHFLLEEFISMHLPLLLKHQIFSIKFKITSQPGISVATRLSVL